MQTVRLFRALVKGAMLLLVMTLGVLCWTGCAGNSPGGGGGSGGIGNALDCDNARRIYTAYLASMLVRDVSEDEIKNARAAGAFLSAWCGWEPPANVRGKATPKVDRNGVPVLHEPASP